MLMDPGNTGVARDGLVNFAANARPSLAATMDFAEWILLTAFAIPVGPDYYAKHVRTWTISVQLFLVLQHSTRSDLSNVLAGPPEKV